MSTEQTQTTTTTQEDEEQPIINPQASFQWSGTGRIPPVTGSADDVSSGSENEGHTPGSQGTKPPVPMQKRRRVTRACDECRRKKIKCDGKQPCTHCTVYSYDCTYDQPSNRRRNPAPQYIEAIENRLHRAEALLKTVMPDVDLNDPTVGAAGANGPHFPQPGYERNAGGLGRGKPSKAAENLTETEKDSMLESMVEKTGALDLDDKGNYDFYGHSSGLVFLKRLRQQFGDLMGEAEGHGEIFVKVRSLPTVIDSPRSVDSPAALPLMETIDLPSKATAQQLCEVALTDALALMRFIHRPTFNLMLDRIFDIPSEQWSNEENRYLPLVYAVMSIGSLFAKDENSRLLEGYELAIETGFKYFKSARQLMDITDCRDLPSIQAVICMIYFLQSSAKLSTCYSYIGIALSSAIRMGLHRNISGAFNPIESEIRKRIFWQIRKLDVYIGALLGLPMMLSDDDIDQELPAEVDDDHITLEGISAMPAESVPLMTAMNAHTKIVIILQKVNREIYPLKGIGYGQGKLTYSVSHASIREIEHDLQDWMERLPAGLKPGGTVSPELTRVQQLLRIAYAHTQLFLYRPFLHYTTSSPNRNVVDKRSYACAAACVSVSRNIIHIVGEMNKRGLLIGAYWFTMYTAFMAVITLVFFAIENPNSPSCSDIIKDAREGKEILNTLAKRSMAADRCAITLEGLFKTFDKIRLLGNVPPSKKRAASPHPVHMPTVKSATSGHIKQETKDSRPQQRASSLPDKSHYSSWKHTSVPYQPSDANGHGSPTIGAMYSPSSEMPGVITPDSASTRSGSTSNVPYNPNFLNPQQPMNMGGQGLPDLSPLMFPTGDPFAYPNQPMTALEQHNLDSKEFNLPQSLWQSPRQNQAQNGMSSGYEEASNMAEVQIFGPMPPYMMHGQQPSGIGPGLGFGFQDDMNFGNQGDWSSNQRQEDWNGWMGADFSS